MRCPIPYLQRTLFISDMHVGMFHGPERPSEGEYALACINPPILPRVGAPSRLYPDEPNPLAVHITQHIHVETEEAKISAEPVNMDH
jgi:hypothetical protein